jgi:signal transduction histidine kinase
MLKLHQHFFLNLLLLFIFTLLFSSFSSYFAIKQIDLDHFESKLKAIIETTQILLCDKKDIDKIAKEIAQKTDTRITIIDDEGVVIAESDEEKEEMENHNNRIEIIQARSESYGSAIRYSHTIKSDFLYVAKYTQLEEKPIFIRASISTAVVKNNFMQMWIQITAIFAIFVFIGLFFSYKMSKKLQHEVANIKNFVDELSNKNYKATMANSRIVEFLQINLNLKKLSKKLDKREKQKRKYTAKLRLINKQRSDLISAISHEFKNPIAAIIGYAQTIHDDKEINPQIRDKFLDKIYKNSQKISSMIDRLTLAVKFENNEIKPRFSSFDLALLVEDIKALINGSLGDRQIVLDLQSTIINADKAMIETVITNLVDNAIKYSSADIAISLKEGVLSVSDQGIGIDESEIEKIKSKFYRVSGQSWDNSMGLGLSLVDHILKLHHSGLQIISKKGEGSTFSFKIV